MFSRIIRGTFIVSLIIFFIILNIYFIKSTDSNAEVKYYLEIISKKSNKILIKTGVSIGDKFYLEYTNSRDLNIIIDTFEVKEGENFCLLTEKYQWFGAGQESHVSKDIKFTDKWVIVTLNREMQKLSLRVAFTVEQKIRHKEKEFILSSLTDRGDSIDLIITSERGICNK